MAAGGGPSRSTLVDALFDVAAPATRSVLQVRQARPRSVFVRPAESRSAPAMWSLLLLLLLYNSLVARLTCVALIEWHHAGSPVLSSSFVLRQQVWLPLELERIHRGDWATLARFELRRFHELRLMRRIVPDWK